MATASENAVPAKREDSPPQTKAKFKSYRKKFHKIRARFTKVMAENNTLWDGEQNLRRVARRLEEELDQLRELMVDVNESEFAPKHLLINLTSARPAENARLLQVGVLPRVDADLERILRLREQAPEYAEAEGYVHTQREYRAELRKGDATLADYRTAYRTALPYHAIIRSLGYLEGTVAHTPRDGLARAAQPAEFAEAHPIGYLGPQHEQEYLERLDGDVADRLHTIAKAPGLGPPPMPPPPPNHPGKDNPMSALNWLRKHQPGDFLPEGGGDAGPPEKAEDGGGGRKSSSHAHHTATAATTAAASSSTHSNHHHHATSSSDRRASGRAKRGSLLHHEVLDDEGFVIGHEPPPPAAHHRAAGGGGGGRGSKRKRPRGDDDDDVAYHPSKGSGRKKVRKSALELAAERD